MRKSLMRLTLRQLQIFRAVCEHRSYSRAAEEMALTQPAVSLQIRQLEELLGQPLFEYIGKKLYLTDAAQALKQAGEDILDRLGSLDMQLSDLQGSLQGQLTLAVESSAQYFMPHLFAAFKRQHPEVGLQLTVVNRAQVIKRLTDNRDDLVIMALVPQDMALEFLPFLNNPIVAVAPPEHPLCRAAKLSLQDLHPYPLRVREPGSGAPCGQPATGAGRVAGAAGGGTAAVSQLVRRACPWQASEPRGAGIPRLHPRRTRPDQRAGAALCRCRASISGLINARSGNSPSSCCS